MSLATKIYVLGALMLSIASADSLTVVNPNFGNVPVQCGNGYAYQAETVQNCDLAVPVQTFNSSLGVGWTFAPAPTGGDGAGLTNPNTIF
jgi:hypothetical protein